MAGVLMGLTPPSIFEKKSATNADQSLHHGLPGDRSYPKESPLHFTRTAMASSIYPDYPPNLNDEQLHYLLSNLKDWSIGNGLAVRPAPSFVKQELDPSGVLANSAPVTLFPSLFPRSCFEEGLAIDRKSVV